MNVERQVVGVNEVDNAFRAIRIGIDRHASDHQCAERSRRAVATFETATGGNNVLLLTNVVLSQQRPGAETAHTKRRDFSAVLNGTGDVLQHVLTGRVNRASRVHL